jgi:hypothetical protein
VDSFNRSIILVGDVDTGRDRQLAGKLRCFIDNQDVSTRRPGLSASTQEAPCSAPDLRRRRPQVYAGGGPRSRNASYNPASPLRIAGGVSGTRDQSIRLVKSLPCAGRPRG